MDRRNFMKSIGGAGMAMMCSNALGATFAAEPSESSVSDDKVLYKDCLRFKAGKKFKIVQFTDIHFKSVDLANSQVGLDNMSEILDKENPDLVVYTGDLVFSEGTYAALDTILAQPQKRNIPFAVVWGNHDDEFDHTREELYDYVQKKEGAIMPVRVSKESPDYIIPIKASNSEKIASVLYCIDSHSYPKIKAVGGYDWIGFDQIVWYREVSRKMTAANNGTPVPSLAFFHIPLPEYLDALEGGKNRVFGVKAEGVCAPKINSGFFTAARECGDIMGMFVGHDHDNDYAVMYHDILLAYGRYSGGNTVYNNIENGGRIIELSEGERKIDSYIRLNADDVESRITYPTSFNLSGYNKIKK